MAIGIIIPLKTLTIEGVTSDRINAMRPTAPAWLDIGYTWMGGAGYYNPFAPNICPVFDRPIPPVGDDIHSRSDLNGVYPPNDPCEKLPWTNASRLRLHYDWAQGYTDPSDVPTELRANTCAIISVASADDLYISTHGAGDIGYFRVGTTVFDGTYADCVTYWAANF